MHWFDVGVGIILLIGSVWSFFRGLIREVLSIIGMITAFVLAARGYPYAAVLLESIIDQQWLRQTLGFGVIFLATTVLYLGLAWLLHRLVKAVGLSLPNRLLGGLFGFAKVGVMIAALLLITAQFFPVFATRLGAESTLARPLFEVANILSTLLPAHVSNEFQRVYDHVRQKLPELAPIPLPATAKQQPHRQQTHPPEGISEDDTQALERILRERLKEP
jgi:membrane protein required for colicin V production